MSCLFGRDDCKAGQPQPCLNLRAGQILDGLDSAHSRWSRLFEHSDDIDQGDGLTPAVGELRDEEDIEAGKVRSNAGTLLKSRESVFLSVGSEEDECSCF